MTLDSRRIAVAVAGYGAFINLYAPQPLLPILAEEFGVGVGQVSTIMTAGTFAIALTAPFTGAIADAVGRKRIIVAALLVVSVPTLMMALATSVHQIVVWRFLQGLLLPPVFTVTVAYIGDEWPPAEVPGVAGIYVMGSSLGGFSGRLIPALLTEVAGWRVGFGSLTVLTLVCAVVVILLLQRERQFVRSEGFASSLRQMLTHLRNPRLIAIYAVGFGVLFGFMTVYTYVNFHLVAPPYNFTPSMLGLIFITFLGGSAAVPLIGRAVQAFGRRRFVLGVIAVWMGGALLLLAEPLWLIVVGLVVCASCGMMCQGVSTSAVTVTARQGRSSAVGLYVSSFYVGGSVGAALPALAWQAGGWTATVLMLIAMLAVMATIVALGWREKT